MNLLLQEVTSEKERRLQALFQSKPFDELIACLQAELDYETHSLKADWVELAFEPTAVLDRSTVDRAAKLFVALEVIKEFTGSDKKHYELQVEK